jgi:hypothetical protein
MPAVACFSAGTRIATKYGEVPVNALHAGDLVLTSSGDLRRVCWIGFRHLDLTRHPVPKLVQPIRILASALANGVPHDEVRLSPDHAIFINGVLVPARLLANGASIRRETDCTEVTYYHVELDAHDIMLAEGLPTESYLDCGNRGMFENGGAPLVLHPDFGRDGQRRREAKSCVPLITDPTRVEPIWRMLADRAEELGFSIPAPRTTNDPALRVLANGRSFVPISAENGRHVFVLPPGMRDARLVSRSRAPCDIRPWIEDRRRLGVMVKGIVLRDGTDVRTIAIDDPRLIEGWWAVERDSVASGAGRIAMRSFQSPAAARWCSRSSLGIQRCTQGRRSNRWRCHSLLRNYCI